MKAKLSIAEITVTWVVYLISLPAHAQESIPFIVPTPPRQKEELPSIDQNIPQVEIDPLTIPQFEDQELLKAPETIVIRSITFEGNTLISDEEIRQAIASYEGKTVPTKQLSEITQIINDLYTERGLDGSGAILSRTKSSFVEEQFELNLQIIEAKVSKITVEGAGRLKPYIQRQLQSLQGEFLERSKISNDLRFLLEDDRIEELTLTTLSQPQLDQKELILSAKTDDPIKATVLFNNARSPSIGSFERGLSAKHTNFAGIGDQLSIDYRNTEGLNILGLGYEIPVNGSGGEIQLGYLYSNAKIIAEPLREFNIRSKTQIFSLGFSQPVLRKSNDNMIQELTLGVRASRNENEDSILSTPFPVSKGANDDGRIRSTRIDFTQTYSKRTNQNALLFASEFSIGLGIGATNDKTFEKGEFFKWTGLGIFAQRFTKHFLSLTKMNLQLADRNLIANEQFPLGGRGSVRGTISNKFARTNGLNLSQELWYRVFNDEKHQVDLIGFFDFSTGWNNQAEILEESESLASVGLGITYQFSSQIKATIEYGIPLFGAENSGKSLQADGILLSGQFSF